MTQLTPHNAAIGLATSAHTAESWIESTLKAAEDKAIATPERIAGELSDTFAMLDPALAEFHTEMKRAAMQLAHAKKTGKDIDIALWRFETAESAYHTRLYEVRKGSLQKEIATTNDTSARMELHEMTMQQKMNEEFNLLRQKRAEEKRRKEEKESGGIFFYLMLGIAIANLNAQRIAREMEASPLQTAFFNARTT